MIDTWAWPNALYNAVSTMPMVTFSRPAASRSTVSICCLPILSKLVLTFWNCFMPRIRRATCRVGSCSSGAVVAAELELAYWPWPALLLGPPPLDELHRRQRHVEVGHGLVVLVQPVDHRLRGIVTVARLVAERLEIDEQDRAVGHRAVVVAAAQDGGDVEHRRVGLQHQRQPAAHARQAASARYWRRRRSAPASSRCPPSGMMPPPAVFATATASTAVSTNRIGGCQRMMRRWCMAQSSPRS